MAKMQVFVRLTEDIKEGKIHPHSREPSMGMLYSLRYAKELQKNWYYYDTVLQNETVRTLAQKILKHEPETLFIETRTTTYKEALELCTTVKVEHPSVTIIAVGQHVTAVPESLLYEQSPIDCGFLGEYEEAVKTYLQSGSFHTIASTVHYDTKHQKLKKGKHNLVENLDALGIPSFVKGYYTGYPLDSLRPARWGYIETTRGCPYNCTFCSQTLRISYGKAYRRRSIATVLEEIQELKKQGVNAIRFLDDNFVNDVTYITELCTSLIEQKITIQWIIQTRTDFLTPKLLQLMKQAGCSTICVGIESGSQRILDILKKQANVRELYDKTKIIHDAGIWVVNFFMIGNPTETEDEVQKTMEFCQSLQPELLQVAFFTPYPGSEYYSAIPEEERQHLDYYSHYNKIRYNFSEISNKRLVQLQKQFYRKYFFSSRYFFCKLPKLIPSYLMNIRYVFSIGIETIVLLFRK